MSESDGILACDALNRWTRAMFPMTDADILAECSFCGAVRTLQPCLFRKSERTEYRCPSCGNLILIVSREGNKFLLHNPARINFRGVVFPPSEKAIMLGSVD